MKKPTENYSEKRCSGKNVYRKLWSKSMKNNYDVNLLLRF